MTNKEQNSVFQGSLFEEDYLIRTLGTLVHSPEIALTELVANAWDAGATSVNIFIPEDYGQKLVVEDNGTGLTEEQFKERWMKLGYNRIKHQGKNVIFPPNVEGKRLAYGRNGVAQAQGYVEDFMGCGNIVGNPYIEAFVVGDSFNEKVQPITKVLNDNAVEMGKIRITTFGQLVDTAEKRLFGLR